MHTIQGNFLKIDPSKDLSLMYSYSSGRLQLTLKNKEKDELFVVSREKVAEFKKWIDR
ncbi:MAG: hypothetical protein WCE64_13855 [Bacteroidales bacterium]